ncbi:MAG: ATP-binding cassette domain-containing protein [Bacillota bacterium]|nr:ATP-binding cassette domain-containing protein [Bacillota bacterium]
MEIFKVENLTFTYPVGDIPALDNISLKIEKGEFITICGRSGCGKSTLLRHLKNELTPHGSRLGKVFFRGEELKEADTAYDIGFVMQNPENGIVCDKVWHELAFGLENMGISQEKMHTKVAEMASFFGIQNWFYKNVSELSGGQKQLLNLAAAMVGQPSVLILDEPTSQLDPIAAGEFLRTIKKINDELGITVILTEHRLEEAFPLSDRIIAMENGKVIFDGAPRKARDMKLYPLLPSPMKIYSRLAEGGECPINVKEGRTWLEKIADGKTIRNLPGQSKSGTAENVVEIKNVWFRYEKELPDVLRGVNFCVRKGEIYSLTGGNGAGKTTALMVLAGIFKPYRGKVKTVGRVSVLPQNPQTLFEEKTVELDLLASVGNVSEDKVRAAAEKCHVEHLFSHHPYDLSGGEQQRAALAKVLLSEPEILLLDEPTKGMDGFFKESFAEILTNLKKEGITIILVSHDIEFCAEVSDRCAMFFNGEITAEGTPREFFAGNSFYTTAANRMAREFVPHAVTTEDVILAFGGEKVL